jgi:hypothetical protein
MSGAWSPDARLTPLHGCGRGKGCERGGRRAGFLRDWTAENNRRRSALAAHRVIYEPVQYTEPNYLTYVLKDLAFELEQKLSSTGVLKAADGALRHYYDTHKSAFRQGAHAGSPVTPHPSHKSGRRCAGCTWTTAIRPWRRGRSGPPG